MITITLDKSDEMQAAIAAISRKLPRTIGQAMYTAGQRIVVPAIKYNIRDNQSVFTGQLFQKVRARITATEGNPSVQIGAIGVPYAEAVEEGAGPNDPDFGKLIKYVQRKLKIRPRKGGKTTGDMVVATRLRNSIRTKGSKAHPYLRPAWDATRDAFYKDVVSRLRTILGPGAGV